MLGSTARAIRSMYATASTGYSPTAVSPESITADVPSRIAFATSLASARVGSGWCTIDSSICVAVITGFPRSSAFRMIRFWISGTSAGPISTPRSPRATITASRLGEDVVEHVDRLRLLDLRDHVRVRARLLDQRAQVAHVGRRAHERERDEVDAELERELEVGRVLARDRRDRQRDARQVDALVRADDAADDDLAVRAALVDVLDAQADEPVVDQHVVARPSARRRSPPARSGSSPSSAALFRGDRDALAVRAASPAPRARRCGASAPAGRRSARSAGRPPPRPRGRGARLARGRRACRARG